MKGRWSYPLILASASPRRRELLRAAGYAFEVVPPVLSEPPLPASRLIAPAVYAEALAYFKARAVADERAEALIIGADTIVVHGDAIIGKPVDEADARRILTTLFAGPNEVITGLALLCPPREKRIITHVSTKLLMRAMTPRELDDYLAGGAWRDKAGAYALQEGGDQFVLSMEGSASNVVGLPMERLAELLEEFTQKESRHP
jgi:septum formation protein